MLKVKIDKQIRRRKYSPHDQKCDYCHGDMRGEKKYNLMVETPEGYQVYNGHGACMEDLKTEILTGISIKKPVKKKEDHPTSPFIEHK